MGDMAEDSEENYNKHFSQFIAADMESDGLEDLYKEVWDASQNLAYPVSGALLLLLPLACAHCQAWAACHVTLCSMQQAGLEEGYVCLSLAFQSKTKA